MERYVLKPLRMRSDDRLGYDCAECVRFAAPFFTSRPVQTQLLDPRQRHIFAASPSGTSSSSTGVVCMAAGLSPFSTPYPNSFLKTVYTQWAWTGTLSSLIKREGPSPEIELPEARTAGNDQWQRTRAPSSSEQSTAQARDLVPTRLKKLEGTPFERKDAEGNDPTQYDQPSFRRWCMTIQVDTVSPSSTR